MKPTCLPFASKPPPATRRQRGFTAIELMVTIAVMAILMALAVPAMQDGLLGSKLGAQANSLVASVTLARSEAIKRNARTKLCIPDSTFAACAASSTAGWEQGWIVISGTTVIQRQQAAPGGFSIAESTGAVSIDFMPDIVRATQNIWKICRAAPSVGNQERVVTVSITGRPTIARTTNGVCP